MKIVIIDNYDSFTYNLYQYIAEVTNVIPKVFLNDKISWKTFLLLRPDAVILSPGPGNPIKKKDFGICYEIIQKGNMPILGVCLGHQGIASAYNGSIKSAPEIFHGMPSNIFHTGKGIFTDIPQGFKAIRYHSLMVSEPLPNNISKTAWTKDGIVMGISHKKKPFFGLQFHPESIGTAYGKKILKNFFMQVNKKIFF
jgi:para-aminobenzoate synthetase